MLSAKRKAVSRKACTRWVSHSIPRGHNAADDRFALGPKGGCLWLHCYVGSLGKDQAISCKTRLALQPQATSENTIDYDAVHFIGAPRLNARRISG